MEKDVAKLLYESDSAIVLFGASFAGLKVYRFLMEYIKPTAEVLFCDNSVGKSSPVENVKIITPEELSSCYSDAIVIISVQATRMSNEIFSQLTSLGFSEYRIIDYPSFSGAVLKTIGRDLEWADVEPAFDWRINYSRIERMALWIDDNDKSVIDISAGDCYLKKLLKPDVKYIPTDYILRSSEMIVYDFNKEPFPNIKADVCFLSNCLGFANDWRAVFSDVCNAARRKVLIDFSIPKKAKVVQLHPSNSQLASEEELISVAEKSGFAMKERIFDEREKVFLRTEYR